MEVVPSSISSLLGFLSILASLCSKSLFSVGVALFSSVSKNLLFLFCEGVQLMHLGFISQWVLFCFIMDTSMFGL